MDIYVNRAAKRTTKPKMFFFALFIKHISALAFLPVGEVAEAADLLLRQNDCPTEAIPIIRYFINTYIGSNGVDAQPPLFPITFWNVNERTPSNCFRTNNCVEGWHRRFKAVMQCAKPGVFKCIAKLMKEQKSQSNQIVRLNSGEPHKKKTKISKT